MTDEKAADAKFREALPKVQKAREAYVDARELFPEGYPELDDQLVNIMKLMRLVRERIHSKMTDTPTPPPVKAKSARPGEGGRPTPRDAGHAGPAVPRPDDRPTKPRPRRDRPAPRFRGATIPGRAEMIPRAAPTQAARGPAVFRRLRRPMPSADGRGCSP
jgi:hypothetical protein